MQKKKRRISLKHLLNLSKKELEPKERGLVNSIIKAQKDYPQITPRMYRAFWIVYEKYFVLEGEDDALK
jgi:hypothetical protein